ncbi:hypothetical protein [Thalassobius sp. Cn5-15]|uniref:AHH domain-containing protein n=1 Tax=Thalassobius sp. Cn5-15 TaxID=2917763 RepID=UPI001EF2E760|nr:hypothetical protein [Thalassobius sp. Cn5-15]MCG7495090.1 hypothetical protein [Thalassobius sp. Cn5-15]
MLPTATRTTNKDYFDRISSADAGDFQYDHRDYAQNGNYVLQQGDDALRMGVASHNGSHPAYTTFVQARIDEIKARGDDVADAERMRLRIENPDLTLEEVRERAQKTATEFMAREHRGLNKFLEMAIQEGGLRNDGGGDGRDGKPVLIFNDADPRVQAGLIDSAENHRGGRGNLDQSLRWIA